ncbi:hypothetical protein [Puniceicoccus vermicola]|uniref:PEP-CTERM sorting domain-containing protein n=1 Tax=Puniceicoccus vermicola TaxID=388746 RepID=A0A7X1E434_9BACT|nr:hypothetical protein [Puniceicoccus vermicola]MBC2601716.1 hypothetical protein [Puniceicoccus vermicola]
MKKTLLLPLVLSLSCAPAAFSQTLMDIDFESDTVGSAPAERSSFTGASSGGNIIEVQDTNYTPENPFGGKSLYLYAPDTSDTSPGVWFQTNGEELVDQGSLTFDIQVNSTFLDLRLGSNVGSSSVGRINGQGAIRLLIGSGNGTPSFNVYQNGDSGTETDQGFSYGEQLTVTVSWDFAGITPGYSVSVDGTALTVGGSQAVFDFYEPNGLEGINTNQFRLGTGANTDSTYESWVDNIQLNSIPEPESAGLLLGLVVTAGVISMRGSSRRK